MTKYLLLLIYLANLLYIKALDQVQYRGTPKRCKFSKDGYHLPNYWLQKLKNPYAIVLKYDCLVGLYPKSLKSRNGKKFNKLRYINFSRNIIATIHDTQFDSLPELIVLKLSYNQLSVIRDRWFKYNLRLVSLYLEGNYISRIEVPAKTMARFTYLDLSNNNIPLMTEYTFSLYRSKPFHYRQVYMGTNELTCKCKDIKWFLSDSFHNIEFGFNNCPAVPITKDCLFVNNWCSMKMKIIRNEILNKCGITPSTPKIEMKTKAPVTNSSRSTGSSKMASSTSMESTATTTSDTTATTTTTRWIETTTKYAHRRTLEESSEISYLTYAKTVATVLIILLMLPTFSAIHKSRKEKYLKNMQIRYYKQPNYGSVKNKLLPWTIMPWTKEPPVQEDEVKRNESEPVPSTTVELEYVAVSTTSIVVAGGLGGVGLYGLAEGVGELEDQPTLPSPEVKRSSTLAGDLQNTVLLTSLDDLKQHDSDPVMVANVELDYHAVSTTSSVVGEGLGGGIAGLYVADEGGDDPPTLPVMDVKRSSTLAGDLQDTGHTAETEELVHLE